MHTRFCPGPWVPSAHKLQYTASRPLEVELGIKVDGENRITETAACRVNRERPQTKSKRELRFGVYKVGKSQREGAPPRSSTSPVRKWQPWFSAFVWSLFAHHVRESFFGFFSASLRSSAQRWRFTNARREGVAVYALGSGAAAAAGNHPNAW